MPQLVVFNDPARRHRLADSSPSHLDMPSENNLKMEALLFHVISVPTSLDTIELTWAAETPCFAAIPKRVGFWRTSWPPTGAPEVMLPSLRQGLSADPKEL